MQSHQKKNEELEISNRLLEEELHTVKDNYEKSKKRIEQLQLQIHEIKDSNNKKKGKGMFDWFIGSGSNHDKNEIIKEYNITIEELNAKIKENGN